MRYMLLLTLTAVLLGGCTAAIDLPDGYIRVDDPAPYDLLAASARGTRLALQTRHNPDRSADLTYWTQAVEYQKVTLDGLTLAGREEIAAEGGLTGTLFEFELGERTGRMTYLVAVFVTPAQIHTIEAAGPRKEIERDRAALVTAMKSIH